MQVYASTTCCAASMLHRCHHHCFQLSSCCTLLQDILVGSAKLTGPHSIKYNLPGRVDVGGEVTAKDIMLATGSVPFVPPGIPIDGKTVSNMADHILPYLPYLSQQVHTSRFETTISKASTPSAFLYGMPSKMISPASLLWPLGNQIM